MTDLHQADMLIPVQESKENKLNIRDLRGVFLEEYLFHRLNPKPVLGEHQYGFYNSVFGLWKKMPNFDSFTKYGEALVDLNSGKQYKVLRSPMDILEVRNGQLKLDSNKYYLGKMYHFTVNQVEFVTFRLGNQTLTLYRSPGTEGHWLPLTEDRLIELGRKGYLDLSKLGYKTYKIQGTTESLVEITKLDPKVEVRVIEYNKLTKLEDLLKQLSLTKQSNSSSSDQKKDKAYELYRQGERMQDKSVSTQSKGQGTQQGKGTVPATGNQKKEADKARQEERSGATDQRLEVKPSVKEKNEQQDKLKNYPKESELNRQDSTDEQPSVNPNQRLEVKPSVKEKNEQQDKLKNYPKESELNRQDSTDEQPSVNPNQRLEVKPSVKEKNEQQDKLKNYPKESELNRQDSTDEQPSVNPNQRLEVKPSVKEKNEQQDKLKNYPKESELNEQGNNKDQLDDVGTTTQPVVSQDQIEQAKQYLREIGMRESQTSSLMIGYQELLKRGYEVRLEQYLAYVESIQSTPEEFGPKFRSALEQLLKDIRSNSIKTSSGFIQFMEKTKETELLPQSKSDNTNIQSQIDDTESGSSKQLIEQPSTKEEIMKDVQTKPELESQTTTNQDTQILIDRVEDIIQQIGLTTERRNEIIQRINRLTPNEVKALLEIISELDKLKEVDREVLLDIIANPDGVNMQEFETFARGEGEINQELKDFYYLVRLFYENLTEQQYLGMMKYYFKGE